MDIYTILLQKCLKHVIVLANFVQKNLKKVLLLSLIAYHEKEGYAPLYIYQGNCYKINEN